MRLEWGESTGRELIINILIGWRILRFVYHSDIAKMYRQIHVHPDDRKYQRILRRSNPSQSLSVYELYTVTYGIGPSAYQSIRALHQLAADESSKFPQASKLVFKNMYVDDVLFGADDIDDAISLAQELSNLLIVGGFPLRKWSDNPDLLKHLPVE